MAESKSTKLTFVARFWSRVQRADGDACWLWTAARFTAGYGKVALPYSRKLDGAHRMAWLLTHGPIPDGLWVLHKCDNRQCCNPSHLFLGTQKDNFNDMVQKGRSGLGRNPHLSHEQVRVIRLRVIAGETHRAIAADFGIVRQSVGRIANGKSHQLIQ